MEKGRSGQPEYSSLVLRSPSCRGGGRVGAAVFLDQVNGSPRTVLLPLC
jgi:hypothetical protein